MIRVQVKPQSIIVRGHANYDEHGRDIVCSSVSSIVTTTVNAILVFENDTIKYEVKEGLVKIDIIDCGDETTKKLLDNMIKMLEELERDYPKNIKVEREWDKSEKLNEVEYSVIRTRQSPRFYSKRKRFRWP